MRREAGGEGMKEEIWRCQFCEKDARAVLWFEDVCPHCFSVYDYILAQEGDD
jgi:hypothetical protein